MDDRRPRRRTAPKRTLIGPLVMLAGGMVAGGVLWHVLTLEPSPAVAQPRTGEQLSQHDRQALDGLLSSQRAR